MQTHTYSPFLGNLHVSPSTPLLPACYLSLSQLRLATTPSKTLPTVFSLANGSSNCAYCTPACDEVYC
ncbi:hypothetical protein EXN66_Car016264 [Channa argus]|uniref:Uncharacterized protein n=1 Tax=Channa argus TaxID=215402 RepID=A0A6G1QDM4_CHAAH|nr:hypothetical protein EXN66_Car016264 [Channa argus]